MIPLRISIAKAFAASAVPSSSAALSIPNCGFLQPLPLQFPLPPNSRKIKSYYPFHSSFHSFPMEGDNKRQRVDGGEGKMSFLDSKEFDAMRERFTVRIPSVVPSSLLLKPPVIHSPSFLPSCVVAERG